MNKFIRQDKKYVLYFFPTKLIKTFKNCINFLFSSQLLIWAAHTQMKKPHEDVTLKTPLEALWSGKKPSMEPPANMPKRQIVLW